MKSTILHIAAATVLALATIACSESSVNDDKIRPGQNPEQPEKPSAEPFVITATIDDDQTSSDENALDSRVDMTDDGVSAITVTWKEGDVIYVQSSSAAQSSPAYKFTAKTIRDNGKTAEFESTEFPEGETPVIAMWQGSWSESSFNPTQISRSSVVCTADQLADNYWLSGKYNADTKRMSFKPLMSILRFDLAFPAGTVTSIDNFRVQMQDGTTSLYTTSLFDITGDSPMLKSGAAYAYDSGAISIPVSEDKAVLYLCVGPTTAANGKRMEIIINKTNYASQICRDMTAGTVAPITKGAEKWKNSFYSAGIGTSVLPYLASNETNLRALATFVNAGNAHKGKYFALENDITLVTTPTNRFMPIGIGAPTLAGAQAFAGNFDGKGHTLSGSEGTIYLQDPDNSGSGAGFFGTSIGPISNLTIAATIDLDKDANSRAGYIGSIVGYLNDASVTNCNHIGGMTVYSFRAQYPASVGGIVGQMFGKLGRITNCKQSGGTISLIYPGGSTMTGGSDVGGICSKINSNSGVTGTGTESEMHLCVNESPIQVRAETITTKTTNRIGSIVGYIFGSVNVYACNTWTSSATITNNGTLSAGVQIGSGTSANTRPDTH